jgi:CubicO group peptidase (beta-lactamase class C family)
MKRRYSSAFVPVVMFLALVLSLQASRAQQADNFTELEKVALDELKATKTPGAAIAIVRGEQIVYTKGFGTSNIETGAPITPDMLFRLGSTTKMFTAAALVKLAEDGKLKLDEPIGKYAKGLSPKISQVTSSQLLAHTAGLKDDATMFGRPDDAALGDTVRALKDDFLFAEPARIISYSNPGYWLSGYVIEQVSGKAYADQLNESLFKPLGMQSTTLRPTMAMTFPLALGHDVSGNEKPRVVRPMADNAGNWPAGSMFSSVNDLSRWVIAFMNGGKLEGKQVLSPSLIAALSTPHADIPGSEDKYGYGLVVGKERGVRVVQHGGSRSGYGSIIIMAPDQRVAIIILANKSGASLGKTAEKAMELLLPLEAKKEDKPKPIPMIEDEMVKYVGVYGDASNKVELLIKDGRLYFKRGASEFPVNKLSESRFAAVRVTGEQTEFILVPGSDGKAEFFHAGLRALRKQKRVE